MALSGCHGKVVQLWHTDQVPIVSDAETGKGGKENGHYIVCLFHSVLLVDSNTCGSPLPAYLRLSLVLCPMSFCTERDIVGQARRWREFVR